MKRQHQWAQTHGNLKLEEAEFVMLKYYEHEHHELRDDEYAQIQNHQKEETITIWGHQKWASILKALQIKYYE